MEKFGKRIATIKFYFSFILVWSLNLQFGHVNLYSKKASNELTVTMSNGFYDKIKSSSSQKLGSKSIVAHNIGFWGKCFHA